MVDHERDALSAARHCDAARYFDRQECIIGHKKTGIRIRLRFPFFVIGSICCLRFFRKGIRKEGLQLIERDDVHLIVQIGMAGSRNDFQLLIVAFEQLESILAEV